MFFMSKEPSASEPMLSARAYQFLDLRRLFSEGLGTFFLVGKPFDEAIANFGVSYAEQTEHDHHALMAGIKAGRIIAHKGV